MLRGIITVLSNSIVFEDIRILYSDVLTDLCAKKGLLVQDISIRKWWELEKKLQKAVTGITVNHDFNEFVLIGKPKLEKLLLLKSQNFDELKKEVNYLNNEVALLMEEKKLMLSSKSWKLTKPLRLLKNLIT